MASHEPVESHIGTKLAGLGKKGRTGRAPGIWIALAFQVAFYIAATMWTYHRIMLHTDGRQPYLLDDTYIQAAIGRNLAFFHTYGVSPGRFSTASSSLLWPFLLAAVYKVVGLRLCVPLLLNLGLASMLLIAAAWALSRLAPRMPPAVVFCVLGIVTAVTPLLLLTFVAMEHVLFALAALLLFTFASLYLAGTHGADLGSGVERPQGLPMWMCFASVLASVSRFEGVFLIGCVCILLFVRRAFLLSIVVGLCGAVPIAMFSLISLRHGAMYMPNSLVMKAARPGELGHYSLWNPQSGILGAYAQSQGLSQMFMAAAILLILLLLLVRSGSFVVHYGLALFLGTSLLHSKLARLGWLFRYESYLMVLGVIILAAAVTQLATAQYGRPVVSQAVTGLCGIAIGVSLLPFWSRVLDSTRRIIPSALFVYTQQYQTAMFLHRFYDTATVVICDVGAVSYYTHGNIIDLAGLASDDVAKLVVQHKLSPEAVEALATRDNAAIAVLFKSEFFAVGQGRMHGGITDILPDQWIDVGRMEGWRYNSPVYFMALHPQDVDTIRQQFESFAQTVPAQTQMTLYQGQQGYSFISGPNPLGP